MADTGMKYDEIKKMKVAELKAHLVRLGLDILGLKAELVERLASYYGEEETQGAVKSEEDVQDTTPMEVSDSSDDNLLPDDVLQPPAECVIIEQGATQNESLMIPEVAHDLGNEDSAVSQPEHDNSQNDGPVESILISDSPEEEVGIQEQLQQEDVAIPIEQQVETMFETTPEESTTSNDVSPPEEEARSVNTEDKVQWSHESDVVDSTEQEAVMLGVVQVVDDMIVDLSKTDEEHVVNTSRGDHDSVLDVQDDETEVKPDGEPMVAAPIGEPEEPSVAAAEMGETEDPRILSPDSQIPSPDSQIPSPDHQIQSPDPQIPSPDPQIPSPDPQIPSPDPQIPSPDPQIPSPDPQIPSPDPQIQSPDPQIPSPDPQIPSPDPQIPSPDPQIPSPDPQIPSPDPQIPSPDPQIPSPDPQIPSPDTPLEASAAQQTEVDESDVRLERPDDIPSPPSDEAPEVTPEIAHLEKDTIPTVRPANATPEVDNLSIGPSKVSSAVARNLNHVSERRGRGDDSGYDVDKEQEDNVAAAGPPQEAGKKKKKKKKKRRKKRSSEQTFEEDASRDDEGIEVEYVPDTVELDAKDPIYAQFAQIFETFKLSEKEDVSKKDEAKEKTDDQTAVAKKKDVDDEDMDTDSDEDETEKQQEDETGEKIEKLSKKKLKLKNRMSVAELKQHVHRPDVVEMHDVTAPDPKLLVYLKACRNTVPVPRHWCFKRKFLQGKRGIIKPAFQLPEFIQKTGIMEMREALQEKEDAKNMKAKMREKVRPKMGKIDIDYQKLHDAFFKWQTKPKMSIHGDLYYEGKEFETKLKQKKPGDLSEELRTALGMPTGQGSNLVPPPWLIAMQRYGPPPSYPNLKIPGLNAPIPEGASFGYHAGGWGKPPVDEQGRPLYGDVFGLQQTDANLLDDDQVDSALWGELESESEESEESEEESEEEAADPSGLVTPAETGLVTPSGLTSIPAGMETPDMIELRKRKNIEEAMEGGGEQPTLYTVLPEKRAGVGASMMGSSHVYDLATAAVPTGTRKTPGGLSEGVEVALDPSELELDPAAMQARYDEQLREQQNTQKEDFSDMVAEHAARQQKKRKKTTDSGKAAKKYKEFKF